MSHSYPSDISREQFARILPTLESVRAPDQAPHRGPVRRFLRGVVPPEKRLPVAHAACGLPRLAHLLQVFSAMERGARPG